jgi:hypothetical protein
MELPFCQWSFSKDSTSKKSGFKITQLVPHVLTKQYLLTLWNSICKSVKGWTNGEIGVDWIRFFDEQTCIKLTHESDYHLLSKFLGGLWCHSP